MRRDVRASIKKLGIFNPDKQFIKTFRYGGSLGTSSYIYYPCDSSPSSIDEPSMKNPNRTVQTSAMSWRKVAV
jgi:hypothetical protein